MVREHCDVTAPPDFDEVHLDQDGVKVAATKYVNALRILQPQGSSCITSCQIPSLTAKKNPHHSKVPKPSLPLINDLGHHAYDDRRTFSFRCNVQDRSFKTICTKNRCIVADSYRRSHPCWQKGLLSIQSRSRLLTCSARSESS